MKVNIHPWLSVVWRNRKSQPPSLLRLNNRIKQLLPPVDLTELLLEILTSKGNLKGLADLDIYTNCNIQSQFSNQSHSRYAPASAALTIDEKLARALRNSNSHHITSGEIICGPENEDDNKAKIEAFIEEHKRMRESEQRHQIAIEARRALHERAYFNWFPGTQRMNRGF